MTAKTDSSGKSEVDIYLEPEKGEEQKRRIIYQDDFEKYAVNTLPTTFKIYYNGKGDEYQIVTDKQSHFGSKSLQVWGAPGYCANVHYYFELPKTGRIGYEVYVKANPKEEGWVQFVNPEGGPWSWGWGGCQFDQDGNITGPGGLKLPHKDDRWYHVRAEMDVKTGAVWIWLDGELVSSRATPQTEGKENPEAFKGIRGIVLGDCSWHEEPSTPTYFDDLVIYTTR